MEQAGWEESQETEKVKQIQVSLFAHTEAGLTLHLRDMHLYLLNPEDFGIAAADFDPNLHEHAIPKFEMARIYLLVCAITGDHLGFTEEDREDSVFAIYQDAFRRALAVEDNPDLRQRIVRLGLRSGFTLGI